VFTFENIYADYELLFKAMADKMGVRLKDGWLFFPPEYGNGYFRSIKLPNGLQVAILNITINQDWHFYHRKSETDQRYILRFEELSFPGTFEVKLGEERLEQKAQNLSVVYLSSTIADWHYKATAGSKLKGIAISIPAVVLGSLLGIEEMQKILPAYIALKTRSLNMEQMDSYYHQLVEEVMAEDPDTPFPDLYLVNRIQILVERFFSRIKSKVSISDVESNYKPDDIETILGIEKIMIHDFTGKPPSINDLSRKAAMSATKFKNLFKAVFGTPVYEYYQQKRMHRAAELLESGIVPVKKAAQLVGYNNLSNFSAAFKKQYLVLPQDYTGK
jgi:AraC-like DNA-binding protein